MNFRKFTKRFSRDLEYTADDIAVFVDLQHDILTRKSQLTIVELKSHYICPALFPLVFSLPYAGLLYGRKIELNHKKVDDELSKDLVFYGVDEHFNIKSGRSSDRVAVPFCYAPKLDDTVAENIERIVENIPVELSEMYKAAISSQITEVFNNSYEHGANPVGSFFTSYYDDKKNSFKFAVYDLGLGFQKQIKSHLEKMDGGNVYLDKFANTDFIEWAMERGNTTKPKDYPRGIGYDVLQKFAIENDGEILLCTDKYICCINKNGRDYIKLENEILGTFFSMNIKINVAIE